MRIAVVTGASSGMGREFVLQLDKKFKSLDEIWVLARRTDRLKELQEITSKKIICFPIDLTIPIQLEQLKEQLHTQQPTILCLVNAAGYGIHGTVEASGFEEEVGMIDLNCYALTAVTKLCLPYMRTNGRIINLASAAAFVPQPKFAIYAASKSYVLSFSRALNTELKKKHIAVTAVCPGPVDTDFFKQDHCNIQKTFYKRMVMAKPEAVVKQALEDSLAQKQLSIYGAGMKLFYIMAKLVPHHIMLAFMRFLL